MSLLINYYSLHIELLTKKRKEEIKWMLGENPNLFTIIRSLWFSFLFKNNCEKKNEREEKQNYIVCWWEMHEKKIRDHQR